MNSRYGFGLVLSFASLALATLALLSLFAGTASAFQAHPLIASLDGSGTGVAFEEPTGLAIDESAPALSGNVFLADAGANVVDVFGAAGTLPAGVPSPFQIRRGFTRAADVAIDQSGGPSDGDLYVLDRFPSAPQVPGGVIDKFARNPLSGEYEYLCQITGWGGGCTAAGKKPTQVFSSPFGIAVDSHGDLFVANSAEGGVFYEFNQAGANLSQIKGGATPSLGFPRDPAFDSSGDLFYLDFETLREIVAKPSGEIEPGKAPILVPLTPSVTGLKALAVDRITDTLYVSTGGSGANGRIFQYSSANTLESEFGAGILGSSAGLAVNDATGDVYVSDSTTQRVDVFGPLTTFPTVTTGEASGLTPVAATLAGQLDPDAAHGGGEIGACHFEYGTTSSYGHTAPCTPAPPYAAPTAVSAHLTSLLGATTYHYRLEAANAAGPGDGADRTFTTPVAVTGLATGAVTGIGATGATLAGSFTGNGEDTHYDFEYGTDTSYGLSSAEADAGSPLSGQPKQVAAAVSGLQPGTTYHYRILAHNGLGAGQGEDRTFTTTATPRLGGATVAATATAATLSASVDPDGAPTTYRFEYGPADCSTNPCAALPVPDASAGSGYAPVFVSQLLSGLASGATYHYRLLATNPLGSTAGPDSTFTTEGTAGCPNQALRTGPGAKLPDCRAYEQVSPVDKNFSQVFNKMPYVRASPDGDRLTFEGVGNFAYPKGAGDYPFYLASRAAGEWSTQDLLPQSHYFGANQVFGLSEDLSQALLSATDPALAPGATAGEAPENGEASTYLYDAATGVYRTIASPGTESAPLADSTPDASRLLFESQTQLLPEAAPHKTNLYLYDRASGALSLSGVLPSGLAPAGGSVAGPGGPALGVPPGGATQHYYTQNTISDDGSRVFFSDAGAGQIYARLDGLTTVRVSASERSTPDPAGTQPAQWKAATPNGRYIFFTSCQKLTDDSTALASGTHCLGGLEQPLGQDLYRYDLDGGHLIDLSVDPRPADNEGADVQGVLGASEDGSRVYFVATGNLANGAVPGKDNLYLSDAGVVTYIATLLQQDQSVWSSREDAGAANFKESRVTPDGAVVLFASQEPLTGVPGGNLFLYDASSGELSCISCNPSGAASAPARVVGHNLTPGSSNSGAGTFLTHPLSDDGRRVFFTSEAALLPRDTDHQPDVYEWEDGQLHLISTGQSAITSDFGDASSDGSDVFFSTTQSLVAQDQDGNEDFYDARVDGGIAAQSPSFSPPCGGEACKPPPLSAPAAPSATSAVFSGPGNAKPPRKHRRKARHRKANRHRGAAK